MRHQTLAAVATAFLLGAAVTVGAQTPSPIPTAKPGFSGACMQTAVDKRDNAIIAAVNAYHSSIISALTTRRDALKAAWGTSDRKARRTAIRTAWRTSRASAHTVKKTWHAARRAAWQTFSTDRRACRAELGDDATNSAVDISL